MRIMLLTFLSSLLFSANTVACTWTPISFCETANNHSKNPIFLGKVIITDSLFVKFEVLDIYRGSENSDTITIWNGTADTCNGSIVSMKAEELYRNGDSIIVLLQRIKSVKNSWDVVGDYRFYEYFHENAFLRIENNTVNGFVAGHYRPLPYPTPDQYEAVYKADFNKMANALKQQQDCNEILSNIKSIQPSLFTYTNPVNNELILSFNTNYEYKTVSIFDLNGNKVLFKSTIQDKMEIDVSILTSGVFLLVTEQNSKPLKPIRIIKY